MKTNVAVVFGGRSVEHEIAIISAVQAMASMDREKYEIYPVYMNKNGFFYSGEALFDIDTFRHAEKITALCDRVAILASGKLLDIGTVAEIKARTGKETFEDAFVATVEKGGAAK